MTNPPKTRSALSILLSLLVCSGCGQALSAGQSGSDQLPNTSGYSYSCWLNGWRKNPKDKSPEILAIQASAYDFTLNLTDFGKAGFSPNRRPPTGYAEALRSGTDHLQQLAPAELIIEIIGNGKTYRAVSCAAGTDPDPRRLGAAKMWESGRLVQHFELENLKCQESTGETLDCEANLTLVAWPDSLTITASLATNNPAAEVWKDALVRIRLKGTEIDAEVEEKIAGTPVEKTKVVTLNYQLSGITRPHPGLSLKVSSAAGQVFPVALDPVKNCWVASVSALKRTFKTGNTDIRDYDEFSITIDHPGNTEKAIPFLLDLRGPANITGLCPILCHKDGRPTGIPVQLSKNWHYPTMGTYLMAYASLPAKPGRNEYLLRVAYGFYGTLPSASHAQLSLIGYSGKGGNGRWDQLAIGCWGETFCLDVDMSLVNRAVTDVRMLMARNGKEGKQWEWTNGGWGGDWLGIAASSQEKLLFRDMKTAYLAHGPCLTDVRYNGFYGAGREVALDARVHTLRTDDHARTFHHLKYTFQKELSAKDSYFFQMGPTGSFVTPKIAYGNRDGLISEREVPANLKPNDLFIETETLTGEGPWWITFPGASFTNNRDWGTGSRALIIRSFHAIHGGRTYTNPTISMPVNQVQKDLGLDLNLHLVPPSEVITFQPGDSLEIDVEWITLPKVVDDYYGPNQSFRQHLAENPKSWKTTYREATANDLQVVANGGKVLNRYPIEIRAESSVVEVAIKGGAGYVPIRFHHLKSINGLALFEVTDGKEIQLNQAVRGNDFWQVDFDEADKTYQMTYNLPLDGKRESTWRLKTMSEAK